MFARDTRPVNGYRASSRRLSGATSWRGIPSSLDRCASKRQPVSQQLAGEPRRDEQACQKRSRTYCHGAGRAAGLVISVLRDGNSWEFRASADDATVAKPGYPECVAMMVQIGDHLSKQYDFKE
jgi:hypothetical protein